MDELVRSTLSPSPEHLETPSEAIVESHDGRKVGATSTQLKLSDPPRGESSTANYTTRCAHPGSEPPSESASESASDASRAPNAALEPTLERTPGPPPKPATHRVVTQATHLRARPTRRAKRVTSRKAALPQTSPPSSTAHQVAESINSLCLLAITGVLRSVLSNLMIVFLVLRKPL